MRMKIAVVLILTASLVGFSACQTYGDVRVRGQEGVTTRLGIVEIYLNGEWGTVQPTAERYEGVGDAVCRQLGYREAGLAGTFEDMKYFCECVPEGPGTLSVLEDVHCDTDMNDFDGPTHILQCSHTVNRNSDAHHSKDLIVDCSLERWDNGFYDTQVRLVQGGTSYTSSGYMEVYLNSRWGPVCNMSPTSADTACRQLGYSSSLTVSDKLGYSHDYNDQLSTFTCHGSSYQCLKDCFVYPSSVHSVNCSQHHSVVNCTFSNGTSTSYGSSTLCSVDHHHPDIMIIGLVLSMVFYGLFILAIIVMCSVCSYIPSCPLYSSIRRLRVRVTYHTI